MIQPNEIRKTRGLGPLVTRSFRRASHIAFTVIVIVGSAFAVQYGASEIARRAEAAPSPEPASALPVMVKPLEREEGYTVARAFIGQIEARRDVTLSFELPGELADVFVDEGDVVVPGTLLAQQDTKLLNAERAQLEASRSATQAQLVFAEQTVKRNEELQRRGFAPQAGVDEALARRDELLGRISEIEAGLENVTVRLDKSRLEAPFAGRVTARNVDGGEALGASQPVISLVEVAAPQMRVGVPLDFDEARLAQAEIEVGEQVFHAKLTALRPDIDPITRTRIALFDVDADVPLAVGQTARLIVREPILSEGFWVPVASLKQGVRGQWTVLAVDQAQKVRAAQVEILHAETDRVFVRSALPDGTPMINAGPQRVTVGQHVIPTFTE